MIYQIGICDDENSTCSELENILIDYFKVSGLNVHVNVWNCAEDFMRDVPLKVKVDLLFLDIELPNYNGIYVGEYIRNDINNYAMQKVKLLIITIPFCLLQLILMITYKKLEIGEKAHPVDFGWAFSATERWNFNEHRKRVCS